MFQYLVHVVLGLSVAGAAILWTIEILDSSIQVTSRHEYCFEQSRYVGTSYLRDRIEITQYQVTNCHFNVFGETQIRVGDINQYSTGNKFHVLCL